MTSKLLTEFELSRDQERIISTTIDDKLTAYCVAKLVNTIYGSKKLDKLLIDTVWRDCESIRADQGYQMEYTYMTTPRQSLLLDGAYTIKQCESKTTGPLVRMQIRTKAQTLHEQWIQLNKNTKHPYLLMLEKIAKGEFTL